MSMSDDISPRITEVTTVPSPVAGRNRLLCVFVLLQLYFASNVLSFAYWKSGPSDFQYMTLFFGIWLVGLLLLLVLILKTSVRFGLARFAPVVCLVLSLPFCFGLWLNTLGINPGLFYWNIIWVIPLLLVYFRVGAFHAVKISIVMLTLCVLSFMGHSGVFDEPALAQEPGPADNGMMSLARNTSVHVIMLDSLTHSDYSKSFLGVENPAADYLSVLDDAIYAGNRGFVEYVPTRQAWAGLFELDRSSSNYGAFSGQARSLLTDLLRRNGYYIQSGYSGNYLGVSQGEYVDDYVFDVAYLEHSLLCAEQEIFLGFCSGWSFSIYRNWFRNWFQEELRRFRVQLWPEVVINMIEQAEQEISGPVFSAFYIYSPVGHTPGDYQTDNPDMFADYKEYFIRQTKLARQLMKNINHLRQRFPDSVFIISGDHGPWLSRTETDNQRFIVLDRHAVALALLNASNLCSKSKDWLQRQKYLTPSRMLVATLACDGELAAFADHFTDNEEFIRFGESLAGS